MNDNPTYTLQKYSGPSTRHTCPSCGRKRCFSLYVDESGNPLHETVGRCDHESSCTYHKTPKQYFNEHPYLNNRHSNPTVRHSGPPARHPAPPPRHPALDAGSPQHHTPSNPICTIPTAIMHRTIRPDIPSTLTTFLRTLFPQETITALTHKYNLGVTKSRAIIYYQIDINNRIRTGKIMKYNPTTGKRIKDPDTPNKITWVHSLLKQKGQLTQDWQLTQCLFGEHLLNAPTEKHKTIALVESEKTAIIGAAIMPKYTWLATGGKSQLKPEKLEALKGRKVIAFPDVDAYQEWTVKLQTLNTQTGLNITVSDILQRQATDRDRQSHIDIADWLIRWRTNTPDSSLRHPDSPDRHPALPLRHPALDAGSPPNPSHFEILKYFSPQYHPELQLLITDLDLIPTSIRHADPI